MTNLTIKDLENFTGIKAHTIRTWELRFNFLKPQRSDKLRRSYSLDELKLILDVSFLNHHGYKVSQIAAMDRQEMEAAASDLATQQHLWEKCVNELLVHTVNADVFSFEGVLNQGVHRWGIDAVLSGMVLPFAEKTGLFDGSAPKHFKVNLLLIEQSVRQKILLGIEESLVQGRAGKVLFYLAKRSADLELLYLQYQLKEKGFDTVCVAGPVPLPQLTAAAAAVDPAFVVTSLPERTAGFDAEGFAGYLRKALPETTAMNLQTNSKHRQAPASFVTATSRAAAMAVMTNRLQAV